jgi:hypothetical protein
MKKITLALLSLFMFYGIASAVNVSGGNYNITLTTITATGATVENLTATNATVTALTVGTVTGSGAATCTTINTGQGANEVYDMNQNVQTTDDVTFKGAAITYGISVATIAASGAVSCTTVNTGQGAAECYLQDQNVRTTDDVTHKSVTATYGADAGTATITGLLKSGSLTNSGTLTNTGAGGIVNTYGISSASGTFTNSTYSVEIASASNSTEKMYIGGVFAALPTTGFPINSICIVGATLYISTETVATSGSWIKVGAQ